MLIYALPLVYADELMLLVNKPAGLLAVPGRGPDKQDCMSLRVQQHHPDALVVHRLDQATSGLMLFARNATMQRQLSQLFEQRDVAKEYVAIVQGLVAHDAGHMDGPIAADWATRPLRRIDLLIGKPALTHYRVISRSPSNSYATDRTATTRLWLQPHTGRTHQLRVHLQALGHPIVGDRLYGEDAGYTGRMCLHAKSLQLSHPATGQSMQWQCEADF